MNRKIRAWDDYYIPGTTVLRNRYSSAVLPLGIDDQNKLDNLERFDSALRIAELVAEPLQGQFDYEHFKAVHRHIFQDVYEWAGEERTAPNGPMSKNGYQYYPAGQGLTDAAEVEFARIKQANFLRDMPREAFILELGERWGEINVVHSFREGNTRTQCVFFAQLAQQAGWKVDISQFAEGSPLRQEFIDARFHGQATGSNAKLVEVLDRVMSPLAPRAPQPDPKTMAEIREAQRVASLGTGRGSGLKGLRHHEKYTPPSPRSLGHGLER